MSTRLMKLCRKLFAPGIPLIALLVGADIFASILTTTGPVNAAAQTTSVQRLYPSGSLPANAVNTTLNNDVAFLVQYTGTAASGTVAVVSGDVLFKIGAVGSEIADTSITGCGATPGTLAAATCTTLGALIDRCNAGTGWRCVQLDGLRSNSLASTALIAVGATQARFVAGGLGIKWDQTASFITTRAVVPSIYRLIETYYDGNGLRANPFVGTETFLTYLNETTTFGSGTSTIQCYSDTPTFATGGASGAATETLEYTVVGGNTTVNKVISDFEFAPLAFKPNARAVCRVNNSAANSAAPQVVIGAVMTPNP